jgi:peptide-methionine (R)-S-oxide reductase
MRTRKWGGLRVAEFSLIFTKGKDMNSLMMMTLVGLSIAVFGCGGREASAQSSGKSKNEMKEVGMKSTEHDAKPKDKKMVKSEEEWGMCLTPEQYAILRKKGTERAFTGEYWNKHDKGTYVCAACGTPLFESDTKFESGSGWPSFFAPVSSSNIETEEDRSYGMRRTEVMCNSCGGHLGHVFDDGPPPTGLRYCINSAALKFVEEKK